LNEICWKYEANTVGQVSDLLNLTIHNSSDAKFEAVVQVVSSAIIEMKPTTKTHEETTQQLLTAWKSAYGKLPEGKGKPIDAVLNVICETWASPPTTVEELEDAVNLSEALNNAPASGQPLIPILSQYLNADSFLQVSMTSVCTTLKVC